MHDTTTPKGTDPMQITIITDRLTDGSEVFNVRVGETVFHAVTERDASDFARKLQTLIHEHTVEFAVRDFLAPGWSIGAGGTRRHF